MATIPVKQIDFNGGISLGTGSLFLSGGLIVSGGAVDFSDATSVTGTFVGDGSGITGVTAEWDGTHIGSASISEDLAVGGTITTDTLVASNIIISSSVLNVELVNFSGSTRFGDTLDDLHQFTGSMTLTGSFLLDAEIVHTLASPFYQFVYNDDSKIQRYLTPTVAGDLLQYTGTIMTASNELDGGGF